MWVGVGARVVCLGHKPFIKQHGLWCSVYSPSFFVPSLAIFLSKKLMKTRLSLCWKKRLVPIRVPVHDQPTIFLGHQRENSTHLPWSRYTEWRGLHVISCPLTKPAPMHKQRPPSSQRGKRHTTGSERARGRGIMCRRV